MAGSHRQGRWPRNLTSDIKAETMNPAVTEGSGPGASAATRGACRRRTRASSAGSRSASRCRLLAGRRGLFAGRRGRLLCRRRLGRLRRSGLRGRIGGRGPRGRRLGRRLGGGLGRSGLRRRRGGGRRRRLGGRLGDGLLGGGLLHLALGDERLEARAGTERRNGGLLDLHRFSGAWVARGSRGSDLLFEDAETGDGYLLTLGDDVLDLGQHCVQRLCRGSLVTETSRQRIDELGLVHDFLLYLDLRDSYSAQRKSHVARIQTCSKKEIVVSRRIWPVTRTDHRPNPCKRPR